MLAYRLLTVLISPFVCIQTAIIACRYRCIRYFWQRLGFIRQHTSHKGAVNRPLWFHCASIGETNTALPLIYRWLETHQNDSIIITTNTVTAARVLKNHRLDRLQHYYLPLDYTWACKRFLNELRPRCALIMETELWLNLFHACEQKHMPIMILNGRLSDKTLQASSLISAYYQTVLKKLTQIYTRSDLDTKNYQRLGAKPDKIHCVGNLKYAVRFPDHLPNLIGADYFLAASTHDDEELKIANAFKAAEAEGHLVIVPRHPERGKSIAKQLRKQGYTVQLRSQHKTRNIQDIYIADTIDELPALICHAQLVFTGGSLVAKGGQNVLEPAMLRTPQIVGPHTYNFSEEVRALKTVGGLLEVEDEKALTHAFRNFIADNKPYLNMAAKAHAYVKSQTDVTDRYLEILSPL